jgi:predicted small lipoprotein YifL
MMVRQFAAILALACSACGIKGPLYLPAPAAQPAAAPATTVPPPAPGPSSPPPPNSPIDPTKKPASGPSP